MLNNGFRWIKIHPVDLDWGNNEKPIAKTVSVNLGHQTSPSQGKKGNLITRRKLMLKLRA
jgi:hypothetical protein